LAGMGESETRAGKNDGPEGTNSRGMVAGCINPLRKKVSQPVSWGVNREEDIAMFTERTGARIDIDIDSCNGCGTCVNSCAVDVIRLDDKSKKAVAKYPEDCMLCGYCELDCPEGAIYLSPVKKMPHGLSWG
jgi:NAD-dependent dihydropyrimidine dehydrogenase PreA subunit